MFLLLSLFSVVILFFIVDLVVWNDIIRPPILFLASFILALVLILINWSTWDVSISYRFIGYVLTAIVAFLCGTFIVDLFQSKATANPRYGTPASLSKLAKPRFSLYVISILSLLGFALLTVREVGFSLDLVSVLNKIYRMTVDSNGSRGFLVGQLLKVSTSLANIATFQILLDKYKTKVFYKQFYNYMIILNFFVAAMISTDRNIILRFFIYVIILWSLFFIHSLGGLKFRGTLVIARRVIIYVASIAIVFYFLGLIKGYTSNFSRSIGLYGGSGLYNFKLFLDAPVREFAYGEKTLASVLEVLSKFRVVDFERGVIFDEFVAYRANSGFVYISNIYSSMKNFVLDFGYIGMIIFPFIMGLFFQLLYYATKKSLFGLSWIMYALLAYPLVYFTISDQFYSRMHLGTVYEILWMLVFYLFISGKVVLKIKK